MPPAGRRRPPARGPLHQRTGTVRTAEAATTLVNEVVSVQGQPVGTAEAAAGTRESARGRRHQATPVGRPATPPARSITTQRTVRDPRRARPLVTLKQEQEMPQSKTLPRTQDRFVRDLVRLGQRAATEASAVGAGAPSPHRLHPATVAESCTIPRMHFS